MGSAKYSDDEGEDQEVGYSKAKGVFKKIMQNRMPTKEEALKVVMAFWSVYDMDGNGVLDLEEARLLVIDIVKEL